MTAVAQPPSSLSHLHKDVPSSAIDKEPATDTPHNSHPAQSTTSDVKPGIAYLWTADDGENHRLDQQHHMLTDIGWSGVPYLGPVSSVLGEKGEGKAVLDLGTGSGIWAIDLALRFPEARVLGVDLAPKMRPTPDNCKLAVHDINSGLAHLNGQFDYVHTRLISSGIHDYPLMLSRINTLLRPGGLVELAEWDFRIYDADHRPVPLAPRGEPGHSWVAEWLWSLREMGVERGGHMDAATFMGEWLRSSGVWEDVGGNDTWIAISAPTGGTSTTSPSHCQDQYAEADATDNEEEEAYNTRMWERMKEDAKGFAAAARPAMARKMDPEKLDELISGLEREVEKGTTPRFARLQVVWARKPMVTPASSV